MRIVVTGISGYIGFHLAKRFCSEGHEVIGVYNAAEQEKIDALKSVLGCKLIKTDLRKTVATIEGEVDCLVHCAGLKGILNSNEKPFEFYDTNIKLMLNAYRTQAKHFVFISTGIAETSDSPYAKSKRVCEEMLKDMRSAKVTVLRLFNPIGTEHPLFIDKQNVLQALYSADVNNSVFSVMGNGIRDYIDIRDASDMAYEIICKRQHSETKYGVFEIGTTIGVSVTELLNTYCSSLSRSVRIEHVASRKNDTTISVASFGCVPKYTLRDTIMSYVELLGN